MVSVLTINGGSSSIKFAIYNIEDSLYLVLQGELKNIGTQKSVLSFTNTITQQTKTFPVKATSHAHAVQAIIKEIEKQRSASFQAIGYRIVHGMKHSAPELITPALLKELKLISAYDPEHLPLAIKLIQEFKKHYPALNHIACFDTSFHTAMPAVAKWIPLPRRFNALGIQRYGFHGLSYSYLMEELTRIAGKDAANGKVILAHLGNGASLAAVKESKSIDTSMGFTPASGIPMGTRSGDLDPGVAWYLMKSEKLNAKQFNYLVNHEAGLLGVSETSSDMRELLAAEHTDHRAQEAIDLFCYQIKKWIGSFAAALGGVDTLLFSGGIGTYAPEVRSRICNGLQFLGIELDESHNTNNENIISSTKSNVCIRVMKTNEEWMIARLVCQVMNYNVNFHTGSLQQKDQL